ncbi:hypothetical protein T484DRAFT_1864822, partial [Baffinella frigidus]
GVRSLNSRVEHLYGVIGKQAGELKTLEEARMGAEYQVGELKTLEEARMGAEYQTLEEARMGAEYQV